MKKRTAVDNQWSRRRYPFYSGTRGTTLNLETATYCDWLLRELGMDSHIRALTWWQYWTDVNVQKRYEGCIAEYVDKEKKEN